MTKSRFRITKNFLIFWTLFIGTGAVAGALAMLIDPSGKFMGMDAMLPYFQVLPFAEIVFQNFTFSGIALLIVNGISNLTAAILLLKKKKSRNNSRRNFRNHAYALDLYPVLYISAKLYVYYIFYLWILSGYNSIYGMGLSETRNFFCKHLRLQKYWN